VGEEKLLLGSRSDDLANFLLLIDFIISILFNPQFLQRKSLGLPELFEKVG
jgi:hypothetical protein